MPVRTQAEILESLAKSAEAMAQVQKVAEEAGAVLRETEPTPIETIRGAELGSGRFDRQP
jgi:hypothetical protein